MTVTPGQVAESCSTPEAGLHGCAAWAAALQHSEAALLPLQHQHLSVRCQT